MLIEQKMKNENEVASLMNNEKLMKIFAVAKIN